MNLKWFRERLRMGAHSMKDRSLPVWQILWEYGVEYFPTNQIGRHRSGISVFNILDRIDAENKRVLTSRRQLRLSGV